MRHLLIAFLCLIDSLLCHLLIVFQYFIDSLLLDLQIAIVVR